VRFTYTTIQNSICVILDLSASFNTTLTELSFVSDQVLSNEKKKNEGVLKFDMSIRTSEDVYFSTDFS